MLTLTETMAPKRHERIAVRPGLDIWHWFALAVSGMYLAVASAPLSDPDLWWHVRTGDLIRSSGIPHSEPWAFTAIGRPWVPTAWLSDVALSSIHVIFGWRGIVIFKVILTATLMITLARQLFRIARSWVAATVYILCIVSLSPFLAERTQLVSLIFVVWLVSLARRVLDGQVPPWKVLLVGYLWANLHGMWILLPICLVVACLGVALDRRPGWVPTLIRSVTLAAGCFALAALTPAGPRLAYWPLVVRNAASDIAEWQPTAFDKPYSIAFLALFLVWAVSAARSSAQAPRSELAWVAAVMLFAIQAFRNLAPAAILIAPFACASVQRALPAALAKRPSPRVPIGVIIITTCVAIAVSLSLILLRPAIAPGAPWRIVDALKARGRTTPVRVLNTYDIGGFLTGFGAPAVSVAIDGRTDNFDPRFVDRYLSGTTNLINWREIVSDLHPDVAVAGKTDPIAIELERAGWRVSLTDGDFVLLEPPTTHR